MSANRVRPARKDAAGTVYLVGAGPGAADLITLRGARVLATAEIVFYDALVNPEIIAVAANAEKIAVGKRCGRHSTAQRFINKRLVDAAQRHKIVVRLKGGDPMLFGRAQEEITALREAGVPCEIVPGITAALAASAELGVSITQRGLARTAMFATPRVGAGMPDNAWIGAALAADTVAIYMGAGGAESIAQRLIAAGKSATTPVVVIENASLPSMRKHVTTLARLPQSAISLAGGPALILIGEVYRELQVRETGAENPVPQIAIAG
jgi:uroporphyrin-III C-methyltransferase